MASSIDRSNVARILRMALVLSVLAYPLVASVVIGPPKWRAPWIPSAQDKATLLVVLSIVAFGNAGAGWFVGGLREPPRFLAATMNPAEFGFRRFIIGLALIESAAVFGLVLSLITRDSRYAIVFAAPAVILMLQVPGVRRPGSDDRRG